MTRDYKAEFGSEPAWDLQRKKQDEVAEEHYRGVERKEHAERNPYHDK